MSAIFGLISPNGGGPPDRALLQMRSALAAHGGDGSSTWTGDGIGLGLELKRVTPEDLAERQPLISRDGRRVYFSNSLYGAWDDQFYPDGIPGVEVLALEGNEDLVVVAVRVLTLATVVAEVVAGRKAGFYGYFEHDSGIPSVAASVIWMGAEGTRLQLIL